MTIQDITEKITEEATTVKPIGHTVKFAFGDEVIHVDGTGETSIVTNEDKDAECTISMKMETFEKLKSGKLNPMMAMMTGKVKIKGDLSIAMKLQSYLS